MTRKTVEAYLAPTPAAVRRAMLEDRGQLAPGAAAVTGRLFAAMKVNGDPATLPSATTFREAAKSEPTFRLLLRTLDRYAPHISTAEAVEVSREWYAKRQRVSRPAPDSVKVRITWPAPWQAYNAALERAPIKEASKRRYRASVNRCAILVGDGYGTEQLGYLTASDLADRFLHHDKEDQRVRPITAANYIEGLIALGRYGGAAPESLSAMRLVTEDLRDQAVLMEKTKEERIAKLMEKGGFLHVADRIDELRAKSVALPPHNAAGRRALQAAMLCAVIMNKPPRKGDAVSWRLGHEIVREIDGTWKAIWQQEKTGWETEAGALWPEVCEILDEWILGGRPDRLIHLRYTELEGANLLTLEDHQPYRNLPTELTHFAISLPSHDLRTLAADYLRRHDPAHAADIISTHLGHKTREAGVAYRLECSGAAGQGAWSRSRAILSAE